MREVTDNLVFFIFYDILMIDFHTAESFRIRLNNTSVMTPLGGIGMVMYMTMLMYLV